jgi:GYF domain 2
MSETRYFLRTQGRVSGPFTLSQIRALHQRGHFGRFHEVSVDQRTWQQASEVPELFPVLMPAVPPTPAQKSKPKIDSTRSPEAPVETANPQPDPPRSWVTPAEAPQQHVDPPRSPVAEPRRIPPHWQAPDWYYQGPDSEPQGPLSLAQLDELRGKGAVTYATLVCKPGMDSWTELATALGGPTRGSGQQVEAAQRREHLGFLVAFGAGIASVVSVLALFAGVGLLIHGTSVAGSAFLGLYAVLLAAALAGDAVAYVCGTLGPPGGSGRQLAGSALILAGVELILRAGMMAFLGFNATVAAFGPGGSTAGLMMGALATAAAWGRTLLFELYLCQAAQRRGQPLVVRILLQSLPILGVVVILGLLFLLAVLISTAADLVAADRTALEIAWMLGLFFVGSAWTWWFAIYLVALFRLQAETRADT